VAEIHFRTTILSARMKTNLCLLSCQRFHWRDVDNLELIT
jgi:hypothetical protein